MRPAHPIVLLIVWLAQPTLLIAGVDQDSKSAQESPELDQAKALFQEGVALVQAEDFPSALAAFEESYELAARPTTLFNIGMCQKGLFLYVEAAATFERYLTQTAQEGDTELRTKATAALAEVQELTGELQVSSAPDGAEISVDGIQRGTTPLERPIEVNPGVHSIRISKAGYEPFETQITVASSQKELIDAALNTAPTAADEQVDEYAALLAKAAEAKKNKEARAEQLEAEWIKVKEIAFEQSLDREERALVLEHFLDDFPKDNPHKQKAKLWKEALRDGDEPADVLDPDYLRTKTEWAALRVGGGNYGGNAMISAVTLRWKLFYWDILRASGGGGALESVKQDDGDTDEKRKWLAAGGTGIGIPWHIEDSGRFEIRFGLGLMVGHIENAESEKDLLGLILVPEGVLVWHAFEYFALQAGIDLQLATVDFKGSGTVFPKPGLGAFIGVRI